MLSRKLQYIDQAAVMRLLSGYSPVNPKIFAHLLDTVLKGINYEGLVYWSSKGSYPSDPPEISERLKGVIDKLLAHNMNRGGLKPWDMYGGLDFDIVHTSHKDAGRVETEVKAYFYHVQYCRPENERRIVLHIHSHKVSGTEWSISIPLQMLMKGWPKIENEHIGYAHSITLTDPNTGEMDQHYYVGVSKRNWLIRMAEHFREIQTGSNKTFHRAWREYIGRRDVLLGSELVIGNHSFEQIMDWEEEMVDKYMALGKSLNMIPGGFKGIKFLHEHRLLNSAQNIKLEERERAISEYQRLNPRIGIPNLLISELWKNEEYAQKVICGVEGRLSVDQVREIRRLNALGMPIEKISLMIKALNVRQIERVLSEDTYSRIH
ncbi:MAG: hypothetical protein HZB47_03670 [Nitrosomonadales bacterium]|nr:hypothetical protein [Nitrosomonadales bacterium]